jgi:hypothetical protein
LSDALCVLSTGGGLAKRELWSDGESFEIDAQRPVLLNGIGEVCERDDLIDRALILTAPMMVDDIEREKTFWAAFDRAKPAILGALLDAVSMGLRDIDAVEVDGTFRMADFAAFGCAIAPALGWSARDFTRAYRAAIDGAHGITLEADIVYEPLRRSLEAWPLEVECRETTSAELLDALATIAGDKITRKRDWPKNARVLSDRLRRLRSALIVAGVVQVDFPPRQKDKRPIVLTRLRAQGE